MFWKKREEGTMGGTEGRSQTVGSLRVPQHHCFCNDGEGTVAEPWVLVPAPGRSLPCHQESTAQVLRVSPLVSPLGLQKGWCKRNAEISKIKLQVRGWREEREKFAFMILRIESRAFTLNYIASLFVFCIFNFEIGFTELLSSSGGAQTCHPASARVQGLQCAPPPSLRRSSFLTHSFKLSQQQLEEEEEEEKGRGQGRERGTEGGGGGRERKNGSSLFRVLRRTHRDHIPFCF